MKRKLETPKGENLWSSLTEQFQIPLNNLTAPSDSYDWPCLPGFEGRLGTHHLCDPRFSNLAACWNHVGSFKKY